MALWTTMQIAPTTAAEPAFRCAGLQPSGSRTPAYARVTGEARCEGFFDETVSQPFIELLSLTRERPDMLPAAVTAPLQIRPLAAAAASIVIQPLLPSPFYRVDAGLAAGAPLRWNPAQMLTSTGLRLADLGFLARTAAPGGELPSVVPVSLSAAMTAALPATPASSAMPGDAAPSAYAVVRVSVAVQSMRARSYRLGADAPPGSGWKALPGTPLDAWNTLVVPVRLGSDAAPLHVDVGAVDSAGQLLPLLQFVVLGR